MNELLHNARILIIDDDEDDFIITSEYIRAIPDSSFHIDWVSTYKAGLEKIAAGGYDLYFVDYRLGAKSGVDFLKEAVKMGCDEPIILLTGQGNHAVDIEAMESGAVDYLIKGELNAEKTERCIRYALGRAETLKALMRSEEKFRSIFEKSKDIIFIADKTLRITDVNEAMSTLLERKNNIGILLTDIMVYEEDKQFVREAVMKSIELNDHPVTIAAMNGNKLDCTISLSFEGGEKGGHVQGIIHDITSIKKAEWATLQTEKLAAAGRLVRTLAHEVRNPLNNIAMSAENLQQESKSEEETLYLDIIRRNSVRISNLISELLQSANPRDSTFQEHTLQQIADEVMAASYDKLSLKKINADIHYPDTAIVVHADKGNLKLAILNIVINAIEAMEENTGMLKLNIRRDDRFATLTIADNGCGISQEHIGRIFEPYYTRKTHGAGLGLAFTLNILKAHKIAIDVASTPGKGTLFILTFPLAHSEKEQ